MAVTEYVFDNISGQKRFLSGRIIHSINHVKVFEDDVVTLLSQYDMIDDQVVFHSPTGASQVKLWVADSESEIAGGDTPSDISIVIGILPQITEVSAIADEVVIVATEPYRTSVELVGDDLALGATSPILNAKANADRSEANANLSEGYRDETLATKNETYSLKEEAQQSATASAQSATDSATSAVSSDQSHQGSIANALEARHWANYAKGVPVPEGNGTEESAYSYSEQIKDILAGLQQSGMVWHGVWTNQAYTKDSVVLYEMEGIALFALVSNKTTSEEPITNGISSLDWDLLAIADDYRSEKSNTVSISGNVVTKTGDDTAAISDGTGRIFDGLSDLHVNVPAVPSLDLSTHMTDTMGVLYLFADNTGAIVVLDSDPAYSKYRTMIKIASLYYIDDGGTKSIQSIHNDKYAQNEIGNALHDYIRFLEPASRTSGMTVGAVTGALSIYRTGGKIFQIGANRDTDQLNPNMVAVAPNGNITTPLVFSIVNRNGDILSTGNTVIPDQYDVGGVATNLTGNNSTIHYIISDRAGNTFLLLGQKKYNNVSRANESLNMDASTLVYPHDIHAGILNAQLVVKNGANHFDNATQGNIVNTIGGSIGASGGVAEWGNIVGDIVNQADLQAEFDGKVSKSGDTMTGNLVIPLDVDLSLGNVGSSNYFTWSVTGSGFLGLHSYDNAGVYIGSALNLQPETRTIDFPIVPTSSQAPVGGADLTRKDYVDNANTTQNTAIALNTAKVSYKDTMTWNGTTLAITIG